MPRTEETLNKLTYPDRDHRLALKILKILSRHSHLSTNGITNLLGTNSPYNHKEVRISLGRLKKLGYCDGSNSDKDSSWFLTIEGKILLLIFEKDDFINFISINNDNRLFKMIDFFLKCGRKENVDILIDRINSTLQHNIRLRETALDWYIKMRNYILELNLRENDCPSLRNYKFELSAEQVGQIFAESKNRPFPLF